MIKIRVIIAAAFVLLACARSEAATIWSDGFETGTFSAWTSVDRNWETSGGNVHSGSKRADIKGADDPNGDVLVLAESSSGYQYLQLAYWYRVYDSLESSDHVLAEWSSNGGASWQILADYTNVASSINWQQANFYLPTDADNNPSFQFRLLAQLSSASDCMYFDDFALSGAPIPEPSTLLIFFSCFSSLIVCRFKPKL